MAAPVRTSPVMTVEEFLAREHSEKKAELVRGEVRVTPPAGAPHAVAGANLVFLLQLHVRKHELGLVFGDGIGYELVRIPHTVRVPDASFVRAERLPESGVRRGLFTFAPDLAVEVLSPSETASSLEEKLHDYTIAGTPLIWVVDPIRRTITTVSSDAPMQWLSESDTLSGGSVIPGFTCAVVDVFEGIERETTG